MGRRRQDPAQCALDFGAPPAVDGPLREAVGEQLRSIARPVATPPSVTGRAPRAAGRRKDFVVGRLSRKTREMRVLDDSATPIRGPWSLHALVRGTGPRLRLV